MHPFTLILLPGMDGTGHLFEPFVAALKDEFKIQIIPYSANQAMGYKALLQLVQAQLPVSEPYVLLGESFSGPIAIELAAQAHPQLLGLVLCSTFVRNPRPALAHLGCLLKILPIRTPQMGLLNRLLLGQFSTPALRSALTRAVGQVAPEVMRTRLMAVIDVDVSAHMAAVKVPCLYLRAQHDQLVPQSASKQVRELSPLTQVLELDAPHGLLQAVPLAAAHAVRAFIHSLLPAETSVTANAQ